MGMKLLILGMMGGYIQASASQFQVTRSKERIFQPMKKQFNLQNKWKSALIAYLQPERETMIFVSSYMCKTTLVVGAAAMLLHGCAPIEPELVTKVDPYSKENQYLLGPIIPGDCVGRAAGRGIVELSILGGGKEHALNLRYEDANWMFLDPKREMELLIDGKTEKLQPLNGNDRDVKRGYQRSYVTENLYYPIRRPFAERLATAKLVQFRVAGSKGYIERCLGPEQLQQIKKVLPYLPE